MSATLHPELANQRVVWDTSWQSMASSNLYDAEEWLIAADRHEGRLAELYSLDAAESFRRYVMWSIRRPVTDQAKRTLTGPGG